MTQWQIMWHWQAYVVFCWVCLIASDMSLGLNFALSLERYLCICHPFCMVKHPWLRKAWIYLLLGMAFPALLELPIHFETWHGINHGGFSGDHTTLFRRGVLVYCLACMLVMVSIMGLLCMLTVLQLRRVRLEQVQMQRCSSGDSSVIDRVTEKKITWIGIVVTVMTICCETPSRVVWLNDFYFLFQYDYTLFDKVAYYLYLTINFLNFPVYLMIFKGDSLLLWAKKHFC